MDLNTDSPADVVSLESYEKISPAFTVS